MKIFAVSYDLRHADNGRYQDLYDVLDELEGIKILESTWTLELEDSWTCTKVRDALMRHMQEGDGIYVAKVSGYAYRNCENEPHPNNNTSVHIG